MNNTKEMSTNVDTKSRDRKKGYKTNYRKNNKNKLDFSFKKSNLKIIALGGLDEIGKNITVFEYSVIEATNFC